MQEEIENRTVTLIISAVKLTARELKAGMDKYLSEKKSKAMEKARAAPEKPSGKQTVRQLIGQNQGVSNIEITNSNIKGFERIARKYGVDFAVKKDRSVSPPKYFVFFKARDADALTAAFKEYTAYELKRAAKAQNRPSVLAHGLTVEQLAALMEMLEKRPTAALPDEYRKTEEFVDEE